MNLEKLVIQLSEDPFNPVLNYDCGVEYDRLNQTASALSFYLRAAEYGYKTHRLTTYKALIKMALCLDRQGQRDANVKNTIFHAIAYSPKDPTAYFVLSQYYERKQNWQECYTWASVGKALYEEIPQDLEYDDDLIDGIFGFDFEMAVSAWHTGRKDESVELFKQLSIVDLGPVYNQSVTNNLKNLGISMEPDIFEMARRVENLKKALKLEVPKGVPFKRFGSAGDGGYVLADDLTGSHHIYSFGVDKNMDFEKDLIKEVRHIHMFDNSIDVAPEDVKRITFTKATLGLESEGHKSLKNILDEYELVEDEDIKFYGADELILKMDIEGSEYDVINEAPKEILDLFSQITMEVHWMGNLYDQNFYEKALSAFTKLRKTHYPVLVHPNNDRQLLVIGNSPVPNVFEILYLNKRDYQFEDLVDPFEGLSARNLVDLPEIGLTFP